MNDKERLKRILLKMYVIVRDNKLEKFKKLNLERLALQKKIFDLGALSKEEYPFDSAANNLLMATGNCSKEEKKIFLDAALKYINQIKTK